jgi:hypothetical protein
LLFELLPLQVKNPIISMTVVTIKSGIDTD